MGIAIDQLIGAMNMPCEVVGSTTRIVTKPAPIDAGREDSVAFYSMRLDSAPQRINHSRAGVVVGPREVNLQLLDTTTKTCILCRQPRLAFIRIMNRFFTQSGPRGVHPSAVVHEEAQIGDAVYIGPFTSVGRARIDDGTVIDGHVHIYDKVWIGKGCTIQAGAVIGSLGFGMERNEYGEFESFPHIGGVVIGDGVVVGTGVVIARGTLTNTVIGRGSRIDALCEISHNVAIGNHCGMCAFSVISGSARVNDHAWIAAGSLIREGLRVGSGAIIGLGSVVVKDVRKGAVVFGVPAKERNLGSHP